MEGAAISRRVFLERTGMVTVAAALAQLPALLDAKGLLAEAEAQTLGVVNETFNGLLAMLWPGNDPYSQAQGVTVATRGAVGGGVLEPFIDAVDTFLPVSLRGAYNTTLPSSGGVALLLNNYALQVNPNPANRPFSAPFANLSMAEKADCFRRFELDEAVDAIAPELRFVAGILPAFLGFMMGSEAGLLDPKTRTLTGTPVAWEVSRYQGIADGHRELIGYYQGRKSVVKPRRRRRRARRRRTTRRRRRT